MILAVLLINMAACAPADQQTQVFSDYLYRLYRQKIPAEQHSYVIFPRNVGCAGCSSYTYQFVTSRKLANVTLICPDGFAATLPSPTAYKVLTDTFGEIETLNLQTQNVAIFSTREHKINQIISIQANNLDSVLTHYFQKD